MRAERALAALRGAPLNFEPGSVATFTPQAAWHVARRLVEDYRIADPAIVRATWDPDAPLDGREMLLELRLYRVLRVRAGVRVTRVWDDQRVVAGRRARVFGFEYSTLRGHLEMGRMAYEIYK